MVVPSIRKTLYVYNKLFIRIKKYFHRFGWYFHDFFFNPAGAGSHSAAPVLILEWKKHSSNLIFFLLKALFYNHQLLKTLYMMRINLDFFFQPIHSKLYVFCMWSTAHNLFVSDHRFHVPDEPARFCVRRLIIEYL